MMWRWRQEHGVGGGLLGGRRARGCVHAFRGAGGRPCTCPAPPPRPPPSPPTTPSPSKLGSGAPGDESLVSVSVRAPRGAVPDSDTLLAALAAAAARARVTGGVMLATSVEEVGFLGAASLTQLTLLAVGLVALATALALVAGCSADDDLVEAGSEGDAEEQGLAQPLVDGKDGWRLAVAHGDA